MSKPNIVPINVKQFEVKQSKYEQVPKLPCRSILLGASASGKGILLQNLVLDIYRDCFERVYVFSPSIFVDHTNKAITDYLDNKINLSEDEPPLYYDHFSEEHLERIITTQRKIIEHQKTKKNVKKLFSIAIIIDDFADSEVVSKRSHLLHGLFTRGRHSQISTFISTQKFNALATILRVNADTLYAFRLRNYQDLNTFLDEVSAIVDKKTLLQMYKTATDENFWFLTVKLTQRDKSKMFMIQFNSYIEVDES